MKYINTRGMLSLPLVLLALQAAAHDPAKHQQTNEKPDCAAMQKEHSQMAMNDPVMQAMMQQCEKKPQMPDAHAEHDAGTAKSLPEKHVHEKAASSLHLH